MHSTDERIGEKREGERGRRRGEEGGRGEGGEGRKGRERGVEKSVGQMVKNTGRGLAEKRKEKG